MQSISNGSAQQCPNNNCGPQVIRDSDGHQHLAPLTTDPNTGQLGYSYIQYEQGKVHIDGYPDTIGSMIPHLRYAAANVSDTNNFLFASWQQQNPNSAANTASGIQKSNPCEGKAYADLDYYTPQPRGKNRPMESGIEHITRRHILLDSGGYYRITDPRTFVPTPQQASKYIFDSFVASLAEAQAFVIAANGMIFDEAQKNQTFYRDRATGNYVFYHNFGVAFNPQSNTAAWGIGVQRRTSTLTLTGTLVVNKDCSRVVTSFPGNP
jgi:hypothetical protein